MITLAFSEAETGRRDIGKVLRLAPKLSAGTVWVNCHNMLDATMPFGG
jgi:phenylacetaldehyde dehydrogenase